MENLNENILTDIIIRDKTGAVRKEDEVLKPCTPKELQDMLVNGVVKFQYLKKDKKTLRTAYGTKKGDFITKISHGGDCPPKRAGYSIYFDIEAEDFRAFLDNNLQGYFWSKEYVPGVLK